MVVEDSDDSDSFNPKINHFSIFVCLFGLFKGLNQFLNIFKIKIYSPIFNYEFNIIFGDSQVVQYIFLSQNKKENIVLSGILLGIIIIYN